MEPAMSVYRTSGRLYARRTTGRIAVLLGALLVLTSLAVGPATAGVATLATDKPDYQPGEIVHLTGTGYSAGASYDVPVRRPDGSIIIGDGSGTAGWDTVVADASGNLTYDYHLDGILGTYEARTYASPWSGDWNEVPLASATFTDGFVQVDFRQCANDDAPTPPNVCHWINSILTPANSNYFEGMSVPQRTIFTGIDPTTDDEHSLTFTTDATQGGAHAYDWLTSYDQAVQAAIDSGLPGLDLNPCGPEIGPPADLDDLCVGLRGAFSIDVEVPDDPFVSGSFSTGTGSTQDRIDAYEEHYGNRTITIYGDAPFASASLTLVHVDSNLDPLADGGDTGNSQILYRLEWVSASENVLIEMAGHLSVGAGGFGEGWGTGFGASDIEGGPYHFQLEQFDDEPGLGQQDNQIMANAVEPRPATITVVKDTIPDGPQDFEFDPSEGVNGDENFFLDDDADPDLPRSRTFIVEAGTHTVAELLPVAGFDLEAIFCEDATGDSSGDPATGVATFEVARSENITCTFVNVARGRIIVRKVIEGPASSQEFPFVSSLDGDISDGTDFALMGGQSFDSGPLVPGTFTVNEIVPDGWSLVSAMCDNGSPVDSIVLSAGETVTCTFTDEELPPPRPYDTYDDDAGDPNFDFDTPFDDASDGPSSTTDDGPGTDVSGAGQNADSPAAAESPVVSEVGVSNFGGSGGFGGEAEADPGISPDPGVLPQALSYLPRTGAGIGLAGTGLLLMAGGLVILLLRPRRQDEYSS
jgi:hypothetical protein